jgi:hypothetical protein
LVETMSMRALRFGLFLVVAAIVALGAFTGACKSSAGMGVLQAADFGAGEAGAKFDPNNVIDDGAFTDIESINATKVQKFLHRGPYDHPSFLETYQSNGVRASDAIASSALNYRINPLVFLVFAEMMQGLIGELNYPFPPERVEYVFRCGCLQTGNCLENLAGFDRQVDCLGRQLRAALDEIKSSHTQRTVSGWGPKVATTSMDDISVTPANQSTAALYDQIPRVNQDGAGGTWLFWNIWQLYAPKLDYAGPVGSIDGRWIGEPCAVDSACGFDNAVCATNYPQGLCTASCTGDCPSDPAKPQAYCAKFKQNGFCFAVCNPAAPNCRPGYRCDHVAGMKDGDTGYVCSADPNAKTSSDSTSQ